MQIKIYGCLLFLHLITYQKLYKNKEKQVLDVQNFVKIIKSWAENMGRCATHRAKG